MRRIANLVLGLASTAVAAAIALPVRSQDVVWRISKITGQAWLDGAGSDKAALTPTSALQPGDSIRTGRSGRVLLNRGAETMLVSPNTAVTLPRPGQFGLSTVIQQAGTILLDVEKRNVQHFEVETPYLAAVVKGTRFSVTVSEGKAQVRVLRGQVQVADFRSGQFALILPGQTAQVTPQRVAGLQLSGAGALGAIQQGPAQLPRVAPLSIPGEGFSPAPSRGSPSAPPALRQTHVPREAAIVRGPGGGLRITKAIGEVKLDIHKVTRGLATETPTGAAQAGRLSKPSIWASGPGNSGGKASAAFDTGGTGDASALRANSAAASAAASAASHGRAGATMGAGSIGGAGQRAGSIVNGNGNFPGAGSARANANANSNASDGRGVGPGGNGQGSQVGNANANGKGDGNGATGGLGSVGGNGHGNAGGGVGGAGGNNSGNAGGSGGSVGGNGLGNAGGGVGSAGGNSSGNAGGGGGSVGGNGAGNPGGTGNANNQAGGSNPGGRR